MAAKKPAPRKRDEERSTAAQQMADDVERWIALGERLINAAGGVNVLAQRGLEKLMTPPIRRALEKKLMELEQENGYLREALIALTDDGPLLIDRPKEKVMLGITVDVRNHTIDIRRLEN